MEKQRPKDGWLWEPSPNRPYFFYAPEGDCFQYYSTEKERDDEASDAINEFLDETWSEEVTNIVAGKLTHTTQQHSLEKRPDNLDEDKCDEEGRYWGDCSYFCDYDLFPLIKPLQNKVENK